MNQEKHAVNLTAIYGHTPTVISLALLGIFLVTTTYVAATGNATLFEFATRGYNVFSTCVGAPRQILVGYLVAYRYPSILLILVGIGSVVVALARRQSGARFIAIFNAIFLIPIGMVQLDWLVMISNPTVSELCMRGSQSYALGLNCLLITLASYMVIGNGIFAMKELRNGQ